MTLRSGSARDKRRPTSRRGAFAAWIIRRVLAQHNFCWHSNSCRAVRYVRQHDGHSTDLAIISYPYITQNLGISSKFNVVTDAWYFAAEVPISYGYSLTQSAIGADHHTWMDEDIAEVPNPQTRPNLDRFGEANP